MASTLWAKQEEEEEDIVIVGGGISGFATALALHKKGIRSVVLERSDSMRITGANITIYTNGWRALEQLGVASKLRPTAIRINAWREVSLDDHSDRVIPTGKEEMRCLRRKDLVDTLANELPPGSIRFGYHIVGIESDSRGTTLELRDGRTLRAKVVIGCDGVNSVIGKHLGLKTPLFHVHGSVRGFTEYPEGHGFDNELVEVRKGNILVGRAPISDKLVCWFLAKPWSSQDDSISKDAALIRQMSLESVKGYPPEYTAMVQRCDLSSLSLTRIRHRPLREVLFNSFRKDNITVAGDAMHVIGPFFGQGGGSALEDAIVLVRWMARAIQAEGSEGRDGYTKMSSKWERIPGAFQEYVRERRPRLMFLCTRAHTIGRLIEPSTPLLIRLICILLMIFVFKDPNAPARYDCGKL